MLGNRTIMLVDMNAFFASVEQACNPFLRGKPLLVGGAPGTRSVVAAASYEARPYGIHSGMSIKEALELCPEAIAIGGDAKKYKHASDQIARIFMDYTDHVERYSIDECFIDITATQDMFGGAVNVAKEMKRRIYSEVGLKCSAGIGPNRMLAKLASGMQKPDGLTEIKREDVKALLENLPVAKLHGVGRRLEYRLERLGIKTAGELGKVPIHILKREFGVVCGNTLHNMGNGIDPTPVTPDHSQPDIKSVGHSYTLSRNTHDPKILAKQLLRLSEMVGRRLRAQGYAGRTVTVGVRYSDMHGGCQQKALSEYIDDGYVIYQAALPILHKWMQDKRAIRLIGVSISNLAKGIHQMNIFTDPHARDLLKTLDAINDKYGESTIKRASLIGLRTEVKTHGFCKF